MTRNMNQKTNVLKQNTTFGAHTLLIRSIVKEVYTLLSKEKFKEIN